MTTIELQTGPQYQKVANKLQELFEKHKVELACTIGKTAEKQAIERINDLLAEALDELGLSPEELPDDYDYADLAASGFNCEATAFEVAENWSNILDTANLEEFAGTDLPPSKRKKCKGNCDHSGKSGGCNGENCECGSGKCDCK